ncbi:MAG: mechanosensitive ion channel [Candidatus Caenarcaniphilales bacterium]|nr:mechanosensitive ion channel [Candidatus Caenarcaniphilales bacterium]
MGFFEPTKEFLSSDKLTFHLASFELSAYRLIKGVFAIIFMFWTASLINSIGTRYIQKITSIRPSNRILLIKFFQISVYVAFSLLIFKILNIDLTSFAVLSGAIGIGLGFGLQKITSNFISGLILLFEKSVQQGDLVELADKTLGFVKYTAARYTLVETFDNKEIMVPNEEFIISSVTNLTHSDKKGRVEFMIGVSYDSDIEKARELIFEAAKEHKRCSKQPIPQCYLREFADSSVNFLVHFWVDDVIEGRYQPQSDVMRAIWKKFKENNITIPFPQRDVHIKDLPQNSFSNIGDKSIL